MDIPASTDAATPEQAETTSTSEALEPATEDDYFSALITKDTSSTVKSNNHILSSYLHTFKNNASRTFGYEAMTQSELQTPDTLQIDTTDADDLLLTKPFGEQRNNALSLSAFTSFIDEQDGLKIDDMALSVP